MKTAISIIILGVLVGGAIFFSKGSNSSVGQDISGAKNYQNVSIVDGKQIIKIDVRGGYLPQKSIAKAGIPTTIRFNTNNTFDCSAYIRIPSIKVLRMLPSSGATDIDLGTPDVGTLQGMCGMGMYHFEITFN